MKNKYILAALLVSLLGFSGCTSLDLEPTSSIADLNYWKSPEQFTAFMNGMHKQLRDRTYNLEVLGEGRSDMFGGEFGGENLQGYEVIPYNLMSEENPKITNYAELYQNINQANLLIARTKDSSVLPDETKRYFLGQAYGLRAFYYFHLLRSWGDVIIVTEPTMSISISGLDKAVSSAADVMALIKSDIEESLKSFGSDYSIKGRKGQWSKAATLMLKAETYLWSARRDGGGAVDAAVVKTALQEIQLNVTGLGLNEKFEDAFAYDKKGNKEIIFAVRNQLKESNLFDGNYTTLFLPQEAYLRLYYDLDVTGELIDCKKDNLLGQMKYIIRFASYTDMSFKDSRKLLSLKMMYVKKEDNSFDMYFVYPYKFQGINDVGSSRSMVDDYPIYRYADLLLMMAEAKLLLGEDPASEINLVRERAYGVNYDEATLGYPHQTIDANPNEALLQERRFEFMLEGKRWYDLRRFGDQYVFDKTYADKTDARKLLWPIDRGTLTNNKSLKQTPGYEASGSN